MHERSEPELEKAEEDKTSRDATIHSVAQRCRRCNEQNGRHFEQLQ